MKHATSAPEPQVRDLDGMGDASCLNQAALRGDLRAAMQTLAGRSAMEAAEIYLRAGFVVSEPIGSHGFWSLMRQEIALACRLNMSGWQLRETHSQR